MPKMSGFECIEQLKNQQSTQHIPVIFISGLTKSEQEERGFELGAADYIHKPFNHRIIRARINTQIELIKQRILLEQLSNTDSLTGLYNRRFFDVRFKDELNNCKRFNTKLVLAIIDFDNFKSYNDRYGHPMGDDVLIDACKAMSGKLQRSTDYLFRIGGEEFACLLHATSIDNIQNAIDSLRMSVEELSIEHLDNQPYNKVTISIGYDYLDSHKESPIRELYKRAVQALYQAKNTGRNKVLAFKF